MFTTPVELYDCTTTPLPHCAYAWEVPAGSTPELVVQSTVNGVSSRVPPGLWHCTSTISSAPDWNQRTTSQ